MQKLLNQLQPAGAAAYYSTKWLGIVMSNLKYLREHRTTTRVEVQLDVQHRYFNDPLTMFNYLKLPLHLHMTTMLVNGWQKPEDFNSPVAFIYVLSTDTVEKLKQLSRI